jgi:hypothetical protein
MSATRETIQAWINQWYPLAARAVHTFASLLEESSERNEPRPPLRIGEAVNGYYHDYLRSMNLELAA